MRVMARVSARRHVPRRSALYHLLAFKVKIENLDSTPL
jgi:hypothetical protein